MITSTIMITSMHAQVGQALAARIVDTLGITNVIEFLDSPNGAENLLRVSGIGQATAPKMKQGWNRNKHKSAAPCLSLVSQESMRCI